MPTTRTVLREASTHPERLALAGLDRRITYGALAAGIPRVRHAVDTLLASIPETEAPVPVAETSGIPIIAICTRDACETARLVVQLEAMRIVSAVVDPRWPLAHRVHVLVRTGASIVITDAADLPPALYEQGWGGVVISPTAFTALEHEVLPADTATIAAMTPRDDDEPFLLLFSSGTTSLPKAFVRTRRHWQHNLWVSRRYLHASDGVVTLAPGPISYSLTLYAVIESIGTAGGIVLSDTFDAATTPSILREMGATRIVAVPVMMEAIAMSARRHPGSLSSLRHIVLGGANLPHTMRTRIEQAAPEAEVLSYYGAAEIGFIGDSHFGDGTRLRVFDGVEATVRDDDGAVVPDGEPGELWIRVASTAEGYVAATTDEQLRRPGGWATVHDQARWVGDQLVLLGRAGDVAVTGGHKVMLPEVDRALITIPGCEASCAVAMPDPHLGTIVAAVIEGTAASVPAKATLRTILGTRLAPQFVPRRWYLTDRLPRTVGGKVRRDETARRLTTAPEEFHRW